MTSRADTQFAVDAYQRAKAVWRGYAPRRTRVRSGSGEQGEQSVPFGRGREPRLLGELLTVSARDMGWSTELAQVRLIAEWHRFVGETTAPHTEITGISDGVLLVQCDSTAWATELRRLRAELLTRILDEYPDSGIRELRFLAPGAPSWRHGPRSVPGRGPRDTYG